LPKPWSSVTEHFEFQQLSKSPGAAYLLLDDEVKVEVKQETSDKFGKTGIQGEKGWKRRFSFLPFFK
jgi:hypothetical protein